MKLTGLPEGGHADEEGDINMEDEGMAHGEVAGGEHKFCL